MIRALLLALDLLSLLVLLWHSMHSLNAMCWGRTPLGIIAAVVLLFTGAAVRLALLADGATSDPASVLLLTGLAIGLIANRRQVVVPTRDRRWGWSFGVTTTDRSHRP